MESLWRHFCQIVEHMPQKGFKCTVNCYIEIFRQKKILPKKYVSILYTLWVINFLVDFCTVKKWVKNHHEYENQRKSAKIGRLQEKYISNLLAVLHGARYMYRESESTFRLIYLFIWWNASILANLYFWKYFFRFWQSSVCVSANVHTMWVCVSVCM